MSRFAPASPKSSRIVAALGPTNTGKTHRAVERMLEYPSGMIGLPLRLLAREVYDRLTRSVGEAPVALITGEEKRVPRGARYFVCTVEAMPTTREVDFLAVDEVQLAGHPERGHVFSDRLLHARGRQETWFIGAQTMTPLIERLVPTAEHRRFPRLSKLKSVGSMTLGTLPPRTAVVAFSLPRVYELAERLLARRGGAAIVLGALSPRARNAQVAMYQAGEVDYMVATDAIGMGLNLDIDRVVFADLRKYDGRETRLLDPAELAQIAGRAGRYENDGSFATLAPLPPLPEDVSRCIEQHRFDVQRMVWWRSSDLDFASIEALSASLRLRPRRSELRLVEHSDDYDALVKLSRRQEIRDRVSSAERIRLLWEVCQVPDYRKLMLDDHANLLGEIYLELSDSRGRLDDDWMARRVQRLDDTSGDIETLMARIAFIRTWTYVAHQERWVEHAEHWQEATRAIEDRLSDALHLALVARFTDARRLRRRAARARPRTRGTGGDTGKQETSNGHSEDMAGRHARKGHPFSGLAELRARMAAPLAPLSRDEQWVEDVVQAPHERFSLDREGYIHFGDERIGRLTRGGGLLLPEVKMLDDVEVGAGAKARITTRLVAFSRDVLTALFDPIRAESREALSGAARGLLYQLEQELGTLACADADAQLRALTPRDRRILKGMGVRAGVRYVYMARLLDARALKIRRAFVVTQRLELSPADPPAEAPVAFSPTSPLGKRAARRLGYALLGLKAVRVDAVERVLATPKRERQDVARMATWLGCSEPVADQVLRAVSPSSAASTKRSPRRRRKAPKKD